MKKTALALLSLTLFLGGCNHNKKEEVSETEYGPIVEEDTRTDEEKELEMIQGCIQDYNTNRIPEVEEYLNTQLHPLPIEVASLPEITSLKDLTEEPAYTEASNVTYAASYLVDNKYKVIFLIFEPTGNSFWLNGRALFQIDPTLVEKDNPEYTEYRNAMDYLLSNEKQVLNWLYGLDLDLGDEGPFAGYREVRSMGGSVITSIDQIKAIAEGIFTKDYLEKTFYYSCFYSETPMFKEADGKVWCAASDLITQETSYVYNPHYIIAAKQEGNIVYLDMLADSVGEIQPDIKRLTMEVTDSGYRLPAAY